MESPQTDYMIYSLSMMIFVISLMGLVMNKNNLISMMMCMEVMLISISLNFLMNSFFSENMVTQVFMIYMITMAAVESAMGLSIIMTFYKLKGSMSLSLMNILKG